MKPALCDKNGYTQQAWTSESSISQKHDIKYVIGNEAKVLTGYTTITCIDDPQFKYKVKIGITQAVTNPDKDNKVGLGAVHKPPIIINPHTNEVLLLQPELYREFDAKTKLLSDAVMSVHKTNKQLTRAIQERKINEIEELEKRLNISQKQAITKINKEFKQKADLTEVWIIESRAGAKPNRKKYEIQRRYLNQIEYEKYEKKKINKNSEVEITTNETKVGVSNIGKIKASFNKLAENLSNEIKAKPSKELKNLSDEVFSVKGEIGGDKAIYNLIGGLGGEISEEYETSSGINVKQEAQWMRLVAGAPRGEGSITATNKGVKMNLNADASVKWTLFEGTKEWRKFFPSEVGWLMEYENYHLGEVRFLVGMEISGFAGANLGVSANVSVDITHQGTSQIIRGTTRDPKRSMKTMMDKAKGAKLKVADGNLDIMEENASKSDHAAA